jgi:hypothetical protein
MASTCFYCGHWLKNSRCTCCNKPPKPKGGK